MKWPREKCGFVRGHGDRADCPLRLAEKQECGTRPCFRRHGGVSGKRHGAPSIVLVDVRTPEEYRTGHKEGALNIPVDEVEQRAAQLLPDKNAVILLYCRTGKRADKALEVLRKMGYSHVENLYRSEM